MSRAMLVWAATAVSWWAVAPFTNPEIGLVLHAYVLGGCYCFWRLVGEGLQDIASRPN